MRAKLIYEKFTEDSDPIADMNIGMMHEIKLWMESIGESFRNKDHALACSAKYGKLDFVEYLLAVGANVHADADSALRLASNNGHTEVVKVLLAAGANVHADADSALRWASDKGHTEVVKVLLAAGADVHANNDWALRWASDKGHTEVVKVLLAAGADVHAGDDYALQLASYNGHTEVVKVLKDHIAKEKRKKVKESVNEKFTEDSDPIHDMNIGMYNFMNNFDKLFFRISSTEERDKAKEKFKEGLLNSSFKKIPMDTKYFDLSHITWAITNNYIAYELDYDLILLMHKNADFTIGRIVNKKGDPIASTYITSAGINGVRKLLLKIKRSRHKTKNI